MTDFEKAVRYLTLYPIRNPQQIENRYQQIVSMVRGDYALIEERARNYDNLLKLLDM